MTTCRCIIIKHRGTLCGPISESYESRTIQINHKEDQDRRNQQVYSASPVKTIDKCNDAGLCFSAIAVYNITFKKNFIQIEEMYEISPYATFSVSGGRTHVGNANDGHQAKTPSRVGVTPSSLDYTVQFKTFGHPDGDNLNATAYPILPISNSGHVKGKSSWHKQRYINTDGECLVFMCDPFQ